MSKKKKDKYGLALLNSKIMFYNNEHSLFSTMMKLNNIKFENESFSILSDLSYLMELLTLKAANNNIKLVLTQEACFPSDVTGDRIKYENIMFTILDYLIANNKEQDIKLSAKLKNPIDTGYMLGFEFEFQPDKNPSQISEILNNLFSGKLASTDNTFPFQLQNCFYLITSLKGTAEVAELANNKIVIHIDLPFDSRDTSKELVEIKKLSIYDISKLNEYTLTWTTKKKVINQPIEANQSQTLNNNSTNKNDTMIADKGFDFQNAKDKIRQALKDKKKNENNNDASLTPTLSRKSILLENLAQKEGKCKTPEVSVLDNEEIKKPSNSFMFLLSSRIFQAI